MDLLMPGGSMVHNRQENLNRSVGSLVLPGEDARKPAVEYIGSGGGTLADPPDPPERGN
jgi:hypothetical protein